MKKPKNRYEVQNVKAIRDKVCDKCGKPIFATHYYIYESWIGDKFMCESRNSHVECFEGR